MCRGIDGVIDSRITKAEWPRNRRLKPSTVVPARAVFSRRVKGRKITAIQRMGKRIVLILDDDWRIVFEPRMTGLALVADPPTDEHLRLSLHLRDRKVSLLMFWDRRGLSTLRLLSPEEFGKVLGPAQLGPDALQISVGQLRETFGKSRRAIKVALLDQRCIAGIGNLYASEILFEAKVDPRRRCDRLTARQWNRIHKAISSVLVEAVSYEGSTLSDGTYRNALNQTGDYQNHHRVYDLTGQICSGCEGDEIRRIVQAQRSTFFCPTCQRMS